MRVTSTALDIYAVVLAIMSQFPGSSGAIEVSDSTDDTSDDDVRPATDQVPDNPEPLTADRR